MTPQQIALVRTSFAQLVPIADSAASLFYAHLFHRDPSLRALFRGVMAHQGRRLMEMIGWAVERLDRPDALMPALHTLGARHAGYGVLDRHYATVGAALLQTLQAGLGSAFTPELRAAWVTMYDVVAGAMQAGERAARAQPAAAAA